MKAIPLELQFERIYAGRCINCGHKYECRWRPDHITRPAVKSRSASFSCKRYYGAFSEAEDQ